MKTKLIRTTSVFLSLLLIISTLILYPVTAAESDILQFEFDSFLDDFDEGPDLGILGDVNGNGRVDCWDKELINQYINGDSVSVFDELAADVNRDGVIDCADLEKFEKWLSGLDDNSDIGKSIAELQSAESEAATEPQETVTTPSESEAVAIHDQDELEEALNTDGNYILAQDIYVTKQLLACKNTVVDLNGHKIDSENNSGIGIFVYDGADVTFDNGTLNLNAYYCDIYIYEAALNIGENAVVNAPSGIIAADDSTLNVAGKLNVDNWFAIGTIATANGYTINVLDGAYIKSTLIDAAGICHIGGGTLNISGGVVEGSSAVIIKSGTTNISGGTLIGNGPELPFVHSSYSSDPTGETLVIESCNYPAGLPVVSISGGVFESTYSDSLGVYSEDSAFYPEISAFITGGSFVSDISSYLAAGYVCRKNSNYFTVEQGASEPDTEPESYAPEEPTISVCAHEYTHEIIEPSCTEQGYTKHTCTKCGNTYNDNYFSMLGHDYELSDYKGATCTKDGYSQYTCTRCGDKYTETIHASGHDYAAEQDAQGHTIYHCSHCGDSYSNDTYTVTWAVDGESYAEQYAYKEMPSYKGDIILSSNDEEIIHIIGWDKEISRVTGDITYSAIIDKQAQIGGNCGINGGNNVRWVLSTDGTLAIVGSGMMENYSSADKMPWYEARKLIKKAEVGGNILSVSDYAFMNCENLTEVYFGDSVEIIGRNICFGCSKLTSIRLPASLRSTDSDIFTDSENVECKYPNLSVTSVSIPSSAVSETHLTVEWTVKNSGKVNTGNTGWKDKVYLTTSDSFNPNQAVGVITVNNLSALDSNEYYTNRCELSLPYGVSGQLYAYVFTDADSAVYEMGAEADNLCRSSACMVSLTPKPDLCVKNVEAAVCYDSGTGVYGDSLSTISKSDVMVRWKVHNDSEAIPDGTMWTDAVYLVSTDGTQSILLGRAAISVNGQNMSVQMTDDGYIAECRVYIPERYFGSYYISVQADCYSNITEYIKDNNLLAIPAEITLNPPADITPADINIPAQVVSGDTIEIQWKDVNRGVMNVSGKTWTDKVYIADSADFASSKHTLLAQKYNVSENALNSVSVAIPQRYSGTYYIFIISDEAHTVFEYGTYGNNIAATPIEVELCARPDLIITNVSVDKNEAYANESVTVTYQVKNIGQSVAKAFSQSDDIILVSSDGQRWHLKTQSKTVSYAVDEELTFSANISLPKNIAAGEYSLFVNIDTSDNLFEEYITNNSGSAMVDVLNARYAELTISGLQMSIDGDTVTISYTVKNTGDAAASDWKDSVTIVSGDNRYSVKEFANKSALAPNEEYTAEVSVQIPYFINSGVYDFLINADCRNVVDEADKNNNIVRSSTVNPSYTYLRGNTDLSAEIESVNGAVKSGEFVNVTYTVTNLSDKTTKSTSWSDIIRLINENGEVAAQNSFVHCGVLKTNEFYRQNVAVRVPDGVSGKYSVEVICDVNNSNGETIIDNNTANSGEVVSVELADYADLSVISINLPDSITAGQSFDMSYIVRNSGDASSRTRSDVIKYKAAGMSDFAVIKTVSVNTEIQAGRNDEQTVTLTLPANLEGDCVFMVETNSNKSFYEDYSDNSLTENTAILPCPSAELCAANVIIPTDAIPGKTITVKWDIINLSEYALDAYFTDNIYISADNKWDSKDILITQYNRKVSIGAASTVMDTIDVTLPAYEQLSKLTEQISGIVPGIKEGEYYIIVRADARNQIREDNEENNICASSVPLVVNMEGIELDKTKTISLAPNSEYYYCLNISEAVAGAVSLCVNNFSKKESVEVYIKYGEVPTTTSYDKKVSSLNESVNYIPFETARKGNYYIYIREVGGVSQENLKLSVQEESYGVRIVSPAYGGKGNVTVKLTGTMLEAGIRVYLQNGNISLEADKLYHIDSTTAYATFNTTYLPNGVYNIRAVSVYGESVLENAFTVADLAQGKLEIKISFPITIVRNSMTTATVSWTNSGYTDIYSPLLYVQSRGIQFSSRTDGEFTNEDVFFAYNTSGISGIIAHGEGGTASLLLNAENEGEYSFDVYNYAEMGIEFEDNELTADSDASDIVTYNYMQLTGRSIAENAKNIALMAAYLDQFGNTDYGIDNLLMAYAVNSDNTILGKTLLSTSDISSLQLELSRYFANGINARNSKGMFGYGWVTDYEVSAYTVQADDTNCIVIRSYSDYAMFVEENGVYKEIVYGLDTASIDDSGAVTVVFRNGIVYTFDADGSLTSIVDSNGNAVLLVRQDGKLTAIETSDGDRISFEYTDDFVTKASSAADSVTYVYTDGYLTSATGAYGTVNYEYDTESIGGKRGTLTAAIGLNGVATHYEYDDLGRLTATYVDDNIDKTTYIYGKTNEVTVLDAAGNKDVISYDAAGNVVRYISSNGLVSSYSYDDYNRTSGISIYNERRYLYGYNNYGDLISETDADGNSIYYSYDDSGNLTSVTDKRGIVTEYLRDDKGNLTSLVYADGSAVYYEYDSKGNVASVTDRMGHTTRYTYDGYSRVLRAEYYDGSYNTYTYDENDNIISIDENSDITSMTYDEKNNLLSVVYPDGKKLYYTYNEYGQTLSVKDGDGSGTGYVYDSLGRTSAVADENGNVLTRYEYNADSSLYAVYNANGTYTRYTYNGGLIKSIYNYGADESVQSFFVYTYDRFCNVAQINTAEGVWKYDYDVLGQLTDVESPDGEKTSYTYDLSGNKTSVTVNSVTTCYESNRLNQTVKIGDMSLYYDAEGNLIRTVDGDTITDYEYDVYGKLIRISVSGTETASYSYDVFGNRNSVTINGITAEYLNSPTGLGYAVASYINGEKTIYSWANGLAASTNGADTYFYSFNHLGSVIDITDNSGAVVNHYAYDVWGRVTEKNETIINPFRYVGQYGIMDDDNGLWYVRARYVSQLSESFITVDPLGQYADLNVYRYAVNNTVGYVDISGKKELFEFGKAHYNPNMGLEIEHQIETDPGKHSDIFEKEVVKNTPSENNDISERLKNNIFLNPDAGKEETNKVETKSIKEIFNDNYKKVKDVIKNYIRKLAEDLIKKGAQKLWRFICKNSGAIRGFFLKQWQRLVAQFSRLAVLGSRALVIGAGAIGGAVVILLGEYWYQNRIKEIFEKGANEIPLLKYPDKYYLEKNPDVFTKGYIVRSADPNDILAPDGYGDAHWIPADETMQYTIRFENDAELATAPVRELTVTQQLDSDLDYLSFRLNAFGFGEYTFTVPENTAFYQTRLDLTEELGIYVDVSAGIDIVSGKVTYRFTAIDPQTGRIPDDPMIGFLPVNDENGAGEGFISYTIKPRSDVNTGDVINAEASIVFDYNESIDTPAVFNTVDADAPVSEITGVEKTDEKTLLIYVDCADTDGSGVAYYDLYASVNGGTYECVLANQFSAAIEYAVESGKRYSFYTIVSDNAGNVEPFKSSKAVEYDTGFAPTAPDKPEFICSKLNNGGSFVTFSAAEGQIVIYTLDGSEPTAQNAVVYSEGILLKPGEVCSARTFCNGLYSEIVYCYADIVLANGNVVLETDTRKVVGVGENSTVQSVLNMFNGTNSTASITSGGQEALSGSDYVGTGAVLTVDGIDYIIKIIGELTGDGKINFDDYQILRSFIDGWDENVESSVADVNGDGKINLKDLVLLKQYINGWNVVFKSVES